MNSNPTIGEKIGSAVGKEIGKAVGKEVEKNLTGRNHDGTKKKGKSPVARRVGYAFGILFALLFLWIINSYEAWGWTVITNELSQVEGVIRASIIVDLVVFGILMILDPRILFYLGKLVTDVFSIIVGVRVFQVYPFDFTGKWNWLDSFLPVLIILGIVAAVIAIIVRTIKLATGKDVYI